MRVPGAGRSPPYWKRAPFGAFGEDVSLSRGTSGTVESLKEMKNRMAQHDGGIL